MFAQQCNKSLHDVEFHSRQEMETANRFYYRMTPVLIISGIIGTLSLAVALSPFFPLFSLALVGGMFFLWILMAKPSRGVYLTFATSLIYFTVPIMGQDLSPAKIMGFLAVGIWIIELFFRPSTLHRLRTVLRVSRIARGMILLAFAASLTFVFGYLKFPAATSSSLLKFSPLMYLQQLYSYILLFLAAVCLIDDQRKLITLVKITVFASVVSLLYATFVAFSRGSMLYYLDSLGSSTVRVRITQWYQLLQPFLVVWLLSKRTPFRRKLVIGGCIALLSIGMLLSATRAAFVSIFIQLLFYVFWYPKRLGFSQMKMLIFSIALGVLITVVLLPLVPANLRNISFARLETLPFLGDAGDIQSQSRVIAYLYMIQMYIHDMNWFTGIGFGHFEAVFHYHYFGPPSVIGSLWTDAHSLFITLPLEMGVLGIIILWWFVTGVRSALKYTLHVSKSLGNPELHEFTVGCVVSVFSLLPSLLFQGPPLLDRNFYFLMVIVCLIHLLSRSEFNQHKLNNSVC